jgi:hypothetical protein
MESNAVLVVYALVALLQGMTVYLGIWPRTMVVHLVRDKVLIFGIVGSKYSS